MADGERRAFDLEGAVAVVECGSPQLLSWLEEALDPCLTSRRPREGERAARVMVSVDPLLAGRVRLRKKEPPVDVLTMDRGAQPWPIVELEGRRLAYDRTFEIALGPRGDEGIEVFAAAERPAARLAAMRVVRELTAAHLIRRGELPIHAAAVAHDGGVTLIPGAKRSGKSSLMIEALVGGGAAYVANDRTFVSTGRSPHVRGVPTIVALREGTLAQAPALERALSSGAWHYSTTVAEARAHEAAGTVPEGAGFRKPPGISGAQLGELLGVERRAGGPLAKIVFPEITGGPSELVPMSAGAAASLLSEVGLFARGVTASFLTGGVAPSKEALEEAARAIAGAVPCWSCRLGPDAYGGASSIWEAVRSC